MKTFLRLSGMNGFPVYVDANSITAFALSQGQTTMYLASGQEIVVKDNVDNIMNRINTLAGPQTMKPTAVGIAVK
jgi:uncharacterized protein YlzI (FlbEa/FlbD family)